MMALGAAGGWFFKEWTTAKEALPTGPVAREIPAPVVVEKPEIAEPPPVQPPKSANPLEQAFSNWMENPQLNGALVGFCVFDEQGNLLYGSPLAGTALCPASALKTVTAGAALGMLGPEFRFETRLLSAGGISAEGKLAGDLVLRGGGDPTLSAEDLDALAEGLVKKGLKRVEGSLRADASVFPGEPVNEHWNWGDIGNAYGAGAFGVNVDHNVMSLWFDPGAKEGEAAKFGGSTPLLEKTRWDVKVATGAAGTGDRVLIFSSPYAEAVQIRGTVPLGEKGFTVRGALPDPPKTAVGILRAALVKRGVSFGGKAHPAAEEMVVASHLSAPLPEIIDHMQEVSDNLEAQCLFLTLGNREGAPAAEVLRRYWENAGIEFTGLRLIDGSGLARATMIRPVDLAMVNLKALKGPHGERFFQSLPVSRNGTMRSKRGAMSGVKTEVGFVIRGEKRYPFALMANGLGGDVDFWRLRGYLLDEIGR